MSLRQPDGRLHVTETSCQHPLKTIAPRTRHTVSSDTQRRDGNDVVQTGRSESRLLRGERRRSSLKRSLVMACLTSGFLIAPLAFAAEAEPPVENNVLNYGQCVSFRATTAPETIQEFADLEDPIVSNAGRPPHGPVADPAPPPPGAGDVIMPPGQEGPATACSTIFTPPPY